MNFPLTPRDEPEPPAMSGELPCTCGGGGIREPFFEIEGAPRESIYDPKRVRVTCTCGQEGPWANDRDKAIELWNAEVEEAMKEEK